MKHLSIATLGAVFAVALTAPAQIGSEINTRATNTPRPQTPAQTTQRPNPEIDDDVNVTVVSASGTRRSARCRVSRLVARATCC